LETDKQLRANISKKFSKFYYDVKIDDELEMIGSDDDTDALAEISEDEF